MSGSFGMVCPPPGNWGSTHPCSNIARCGENNIQQKNWKSKKSKGIPPGEGNPWANGLAKMATGLCAWCFPDSCMIDLVHFTVGVWVVFGVVVGPILGSGIPVIMELFLRAAAM